MSFSKLRHKIAAPIVSELDARTLRAEARAEKAEARAEKAETDAAMALSEAAICRAQLMQLRVTQHNEGGRIGWMVSAFIAQEVLEQLNRDNVEPFIKHVARSLVRQAVQGIFRVLPHSGKVFGLVFGPVTTDNDGNTRVRVDSLAGVELNPKTGEAWESAAEVKRIAAGVPPGPGRRIYPPDYLKIPGNSPIE